MTNTTTRTNTMVVVVTMDMLREARESVPVLARLGQGREIAADWCVKHARGYLADAQIIASIIADASEVGPALSFWTDVYCVIDTRRLESCRAAKAAA